MFKKKELLLSLFLVSALMTGCAGGTKSDGSRMETTAQGESTATETTSEETAAVAEKTGNVSESLELPFPLGQEIQSDSFTGTAYISQMIPHEDIYHFPQTNHITFEPGARSSWHSHGGMVLLVTGGVGYYQEEGKTAQILCQGDVVNIEAGVRHWHGAAPGSWFSQMVIYDSEYTPETDAEPETPVSDEEYANLETEEYADRSESGNTTGIRELQWTGLCVNDYRS